MEIQDLYYLTGFYTIGDSAPQALVVPLEEPPFLVARLIECDLVPKLSWVPKANPKRTTTTTKLACRRSGERWF